MSELSNTAARLLALAEACEKAARIDADCYDDLERACDPQTISTLCKAVVELERDAERLALIEKLAQTRIGAGSQADAILIAVHCKIPIRGAIDSIADIPAAIATRENERTTVRQPDK